MIKLIKHTPTAWAGNGMGNTRASWVVRGRENLRLVEHRAGWWKAYDDTTGHVVVAFAKSRAACVADLEAVIDQL